MAAKRNQLLDEAAQAGLGRRRHLSLSCENSSLVRPISKWSTSNCPPRSMTASKIVVEELRVDEVALGLDDDGGEVVEWT